MMDFDQGDSASHETQEMPSQMISIIIPVYNSSTTLSRCLEAIYASRYREFECIVVDDGSTDDSNGIAEEFTAKVIKLSGGPFGPAYARNRGAEVAEGTILFFVDADVAIRPDTVCKLVESFSNYPQVSAVFGSYDDSPESQNFLSQYKNLFHHFVHQQGWGRASTFWAGCGAIRREVFVEVGEFDEEGYTRPSIEDIELGYRLRAAGHRIMLNKDIQGKHLKRWSLTKLIKSDVFDRGIPWTHLILRNRNLPNDLNLRASQRLSALLLWMALLLVGLNGLTKNVVLLSLFSALFLLAAGNWNSDEGPPLDVNGRPSKSIMLSLMGAVVGFAIYSANSWLLLSFVPLFIVSLARGVISHSRVHWNQVLFIALVLGFVGGFTGLVVSLPTMLSVPLTLILSMIVLLNYPLYAFLTRKRGLAFAVAVVPYQLLYYFYSVLAFGIGFALSLWPVNMALKGSGRPNMPSDTQ